MFNVSALLLADALTKCVVTAVVLFSDVAFKTLIFHKRHIWSVIGSLVTDFLLILTVKKVRKFVNIWWSYTAYKKYVKFIRQPCIRSCSFHVEDRDSFKKYENDFVNKVQCKIADSLQLLSGTFCVDINLSLELIRERGTVKFCCHRSTFYSSV